MEDSVWLEWIAEVMATKPVGNELLESQRGQEVVDLLLDLERNDFNWHRGDADVFWIDAQMCIRDRVKGATIGAFLQGILISFLPVFLMPVLGNLGFAGSTFSDADFGVSGIFLGVLADNGGTTLVAIGILVVLAIMIGLSVFTKESEKGM